MLKKAIYLLFVVVLVLFCLCSCGQSTDSTNNTTELETSASAPAADMVSNEETQGMILETTSEEIPCVDELQIRMDLLEAEVNFFDIHNENTRFDIASVEILSRDTDVDYDEIHIAVNFSNTYYTATANYALYYCYYDDGGWRLDYCQRISYQCFAIGNPAADSAVIAFLQNHFTTCEITNRTQTVDAYGVFVDTVDFNATLEFPYLTANFSGRVIMQFYDDCWHETYDFWPVSYDWSAFEGTFRYKDQSVSLGPGAFSADVKISISNIMQMSEKELRLTYSGSVYLYDRSGGYIQENEDIPEKTRDFKIHFKPVTILGKEIDIPWEIRYISVPWYGTFAIFLNRDSGVDATDDTTYGWSFAHLERVVSNEEVQDAIDRLHQMNP